MKALKTKVILSGIVLVFAFIATIGTTFAWFTVSQTAEVEQLTLNVTASDNLLIKVWDQGEGDTSAPAGDALDPQKYFTTLDNSAFTNTAEYADLLTWQLSPVTALQSYGDGSATYGEINGTDLQLIDNDATRTISTTGPNANSAIGNYIELKFWLYSQSSDTKNIQLSSLVIDSQNSVAGDGINDSTGQTDVSNAVRLSVFESTVTDGANAYIFGNDRDFGFKWESGQEGFFSGTESVSNGFNSLLITGDIQNAYDPLNPTTTGLLDESVTNEGNVLTNSTVDLEATNILSLTSETPTLVTVLIFIEGWGAQTTNNIINSQFTIAFGFKFEE